MNPTIPVLCLWFLTAALPLIAGPTETQRQFLSGHGNNDPVHWQFFCTEGMNSGFWTNIAVPSNWELQGFGAYNYGGDKPARKSHETGIYRHAFTVPSSWHGMRIFLVFEGVMTDTEATVNGKTAGPVHQGGFYRFRYEVSDLVRSGQTNQLEVKVSKVSANPSVEDAERLADYWVFGGIYRPVYLEAVPPAYIDWTAVDARADGHFEMNVHCRGLEEPMQLKVRIVDAANAGIAETAETSIGASTETNAVVRARISNPKLWSAETPNLYYALTELYRNGTLLHSTRTRFGFRTFEVRPGQGLFLNGRRIFLQGANRHSFWPESGRALNRDICYDDVRLMKSMNMNAARMSHYPPDSDFLEACDELGLYVLDELAGWQRPPYEQQIGKRLIGQLVIRDVNHPCILFWDNGNEGGWDPSVDAEFWNYDPQRRHVLHPWESNQGVNTAHYRNFADHVRILAGEAVPGGHPRYVPGDLYLPTEFLHGLYDGGHGAGLADYWRETRKSPLGCGGFLWALLDEAVARTDRDGQLDAAGNLAPDGIVGPHREKEGSYFTIKEIWSPVQIEQPDLKKDFDGSLTIENQYAFTSLTQCLFEWNLVEFSKPGSSNSGHKVREHGTLEGPDVAPGGKGSLKIPLPKEWNRRDALFLTARGPGGEELWTWSWPIRSMKEMGGDLIGRVQSPMPPSASILGELLQVRVGNLTVEFDLRSGRLNSVAKDGRFPLSNGPRLVPAPATSDGFAAVSHFPVANGYEIAATNGVLSWSWIVRNTGDLELNCRYSAEGEMDYSGITFDFPESEMKSKRWLGAGPYRVWKNRMQGVKTDVWEVDFNDTEPGKQWQYPEFKGYFRDVFWAHVRSPSGTTTILNLSGEGFVRIGTPKHGEQEQSAKAPFPEGDLSFLHCIPAIGNKFSPAKDLGPQSQKTKMSGDYALSLLFRFSPSSKEASAP